MSGELLAISCGVILPKSEIPLGEGLDSNLFEKVAEVVQLLVYRLIHLVHGLLLPEPEDLHLQDLHPGLIEDDRIQFDAFAEAIVTGKDR